MKPLRRADRPERFPVIYLTDGDAFFDALAALASCMQLCGDAPRFILVGIGYENASEARLLRWRDLYPHDIRARYRREIEIVGRSSLVSEEHDLATITQTSDARDFLQFIRRELIPFVDGACPTLADDNSYFGYSAGGGFGLYTLFAEPATFKRYILGSPGVSYESHHFGIELAQAYIRSARALNAKVFMSVGALEEFENGYDQLDLVTGYYLLAKFLKRSAIPGLDLTVQIFPDETHSTAWSLAFSRGLKALFGPAHETSYLPDFTRK